MGNQNSVKILPSTTPLQAKAENTSVNGTPSPTALDIPTTQHDMVEVDQADGANQSKKGRISCSSIISSPSRSPLNDNTKKWLKSQSTKCIESFLSHGLADMENVQESLNAILSSHGGRQAFIEFMKEELSSEELLYWEDLKILRRMVLNYNNVAAIQSDQSMMNDDDDADAEVLKKRVSGSSTDTPSTLQFPDVRSAAAADLLVLVGSAAADANASNDHYGKGYSINDGGVSNEGQDHRALLLEEFVTATQNDLMTIVAMRSFPVFLISPMYKDWRERERNLLHESLSGDNLAKQFTNDSTEDESPHSSSEVIIGEEELAKLGGRSSWLAHLIGAVENLPICITLASADPEQPGFPLIYVNAKFEQDMGYSRTEVIGRNCKFLQDEQTEPDAIAELSSALNLAQKVKVKITNRRKDGTHFTNLLAMKPIFDQHGLYKYVIGIQLVRTDNEDAVTAKSRLMFAKQMLGLLPDIIVVGEGEGEEGNMNDFPTAARPPHVSSDRS